MSNLLFITENFNSNLIPSNNLILNWIEIILNWIEYILYSIQLKWIELNPFELDLNLTVIILTAIKNGIKYFNLNFGNRIFYFWPSFIVFWIFVFENISFGLSYKRISFFIKKNFLSYIQRWLWWCVCSSHSQFNRCYDVFWCGYCDVDAANVMKCECCDPNIVMLMWMNMWVNMWGEKMFDWKGNTIFLLWIWTKHYNHLIIIIMIFMMKLHSKE